MAQLEVEKSESQDRSVIELVEGDITREKVDAIVNAANNSLLGGGGVDGAIHRAGGSRVLDECRKLNGCETGDAKITTGGDLPAKYVIHTVGPIYYDGTRGEPKLLESAYRRSLRVADENGVRSLAFPSISTGAYRFPIGEAARIALSTTHTYLAGSSGIRLVRFVLFSRGDYLVYEEAMKEVAAD